MLPIPEKDGAVCLNPYSELSAPLRRERLNTLQDFLDRELSGRDCPAALRAAASAVTEELFSAALSGTSEDNGSFTCRVRRSGSISFSFFHGERPFLPDLSGLHTLPRQSPARGLRLQVRGQECLLLVERG